MNTQALASPQARQRGAIRQSFRTVLNAFPAHSQISVCYPIEMIRDSRLHPWLLSLLCVAILAVRVGGVHLHLCFDGKEAPSAVHWFDSGFHHSTELGVSAPHQDTDLTATGEMLAKPGKSSFDPSFLFVAALLSWLLLLSAPRFERPHRVTLIPGAPAFLRPFLRGPPVSFSH